MAELGIAKETMLNIFSSDQTDILLDVDEEELLEIVPIEEESPDTPAASL